MLVVVISVCRVQVAVVHVVDVVIVRRRFVPAGGSVHVGMTSMGHVGQWMLVVVVLVRSMGVSLMHVVNVTLALHAGVPAAGAVLVIYVHVFRVVCVFGTGHGSSLLC